MTYDPTLKARSNALAELSETLSDSEMVVAEDAIDKYMDHLEEHLGTASALICDDETGTLEIISEGSSS